MTGNLATMACAGGYLRVRIGRTQFLLAVTEPVHVSRAAGDDEPRTALQPDDGVPVLSIDETLRPAAAGTATAGCRLILRSGTENIAVACDAADLVGPEGVKLYALPPCMFTPESVFSAAASLGDNIHGVCRAEDLLAALASPPGGYTAGAGDTP
ncbi:MAG: hypothetical protein A3H91_09800 [Gammaproteobacteria bacterium RIFCSPLOWO2_02_FULL_61_13]|nr:MAG: hypothetical protein A3H91_09800 [Gammaproteobacteria bacterium RIFCSPLOWO2_02_FULL_61_13]